MTAHSWSTAPTPWVLRRIGRRHVAIKEGISWSKTSSSAPQQLQTIVLGNPDPTSCLVTGKHRIDLPTFHGGKSSGVIEGVCGTCGIRKVYPARPKWKKSSVGASPGAEALILDLPTHSGATIGWDACLDALIHVGGGSLGALRAGSHATRRLQPLRRLVSSHARRPGPHRRPTRRVPATCGVGGESRLSRGDASTRLRAPGRVVEPVKTRTRRKHSTPSAAPSNARAIRTPSAPGSRVASAPTQLTALVDQAGLEAYVVPDAVGRMLAALPPLSALEAALPE